MTIINDGEGAALSPEDRAVEEARRGLRCLYLEAPESVCQDVSNRVEAAFGALRLVTADAEKRGAAALLMIITASMSDTLKQLTDEIRISKKEIDPVHVAERLAACVTSITAGEL